MRYMFSEKNFLGSNATKSLYSKACNDKHHELMQSVCQIEKDQLYDVLMVPDKSGESVWHTVAKYQGLAGFFELVQYIEKNIEMNQQQWLDVFNAQNTLGQTLWYELVRHSENSGMERLSVVSLGDEHQIDGASEEERVFPYAQLREILDWIVEKRLIDRAHWYELLSIKNVKGNTFLHMSIREKGHVHLLNMFLDLLSKTRRFSLLTQPHDGHGSLIDYVVQYCFDVKSLSSVVNQFDLNQWRAFFSDQKSGDECATLLHHAAQFQDAKGFKVILDLLDKSQQSIFLKEDGCDQTVLDICALYQTIDGLRQVVCFFDLSELLELHAGQKKQGVNITRLSRGRKKEDEIKSMFRQVNFEMILICLKYIADVDQKDSQYNLSVSFTALIDEPSEENKVALIRQLHSISTFSIATLLSCCGNKTMITGKRLASLLEEDCDVPTCIDVVAMPVVSKI